MSREVERREALEFVKNGDKIEAEIVFNASRSTKRVKPAFQHFTER